MTDKPANSTVNPLEAIKLFNEFQSQSRARFEATLKLVMGTSGAMLTLSVGALLSTTPAKIPEHLLCSLQFGIGLLFFSIAASTLLMSLMTVATYHMGVRWQKALESKDVSFKLIVTWGWLRILNVVLASLILCSFLVGIGLLARVAIGVTSQIPEISLPKPQKQERAPVALPSHTQPEKHLTNPPDKPPPVATELKR